MRLLRLLLLIAAIATAVILIAVFIIARNRPVPVAPLRQTMSVVRQANAHPTVVNATPQTRGAAKLP